MDPVVHRLIHGIATNNLRRGHAAIKWRTAESREFSTHDVMPVQCVIWQWSSLVLYGTVAWLGRCEGRTGSSGGSAACSGGGRTLLCRCEPLRSLRRKLSSRDIFPCTCMTSPSA